MILTMKCPDEVFGSNDRGDLLAYGCRRWKREQYSSYFFWSHWRRYYLSELQVRKKWLSKQTPLTCGDLVIIKNKRDKRISCPLGIIVFVKRSADGLMRTVNVRTGRSCNFSRNKHEVCERPISQIILLCKAGAVN